MGSKVIHRTDLHLTLQLEMVISRCNNDPCPTVRDDTTAGDTRHPSQSVCERGCERGCTAVARLRIRTQNASPDKCLESIAINILLHQYNISENGSIILGGKKTQCNICAYA